MRKTLATFSIWLLAVSAQQGVPQGGSNSTGVPRGTVTFSTTRQLVVEDVIVKSQNGSPVDNLKAGDFLVTEDGKPQPISVFEFQKLSDEAVPAPPPALQKRTEVAAAAPPPAAKALTAVEIAPEMSCSPP